MRFPVMLEHFGLRPGSGGSGAHPAGDGTERRIRFLERMDCAILSSHRASPPRGLAGGGDGQGRPDLGAPQGRHRRGAECLRPDRAGAGRGRHRHHPHSRRLRGRIVCRQAGARRRAGPWLHVFFSVRILAAAGFERQNRRLTLLCSETLSERRLHAFQQGVGAVSDATCEARAPALPTERCAWRYPLTGASALCPSLSSPASTKPAISRP